MPNLALAPDGTAHLVWYDYRHDGNNAEILFKSRTGGAFDVAPGDGPDLNLSGNAGESHFPALAAGPDGTLHVAWRDDSTGSFRIRYCQRSPEGIWGAGEWLTPEGVPADGVTLAAAPDGSLLAAWADARTGGKAIHTRMRSAAGPWGPTRRATPDTDGAEDPALARDPEGTWHLLWQDARISAFNREIFAQSSADGVTWDSTGATHTRLCDGGGLSSRPTLLAGQDGMLFVVWQDARHGSAEIYFRAGFPSSVSVPDADSGPVRPLFAWPNPFRTSIRLAGLPDGMREVVVHDTAGRRLARLPIAGGGASWDGRTEAGEPAPAGIYFLHGRVSGSAIRLGKVVRAR
jgi:hypothetical protein